MIVMEDVWTQGHKREIERARVVTSESYPISHYVTILCAVQVSEVKGRSGQFMLWWFSGCGTPRTDTLRLRLRLRALAKSFLLVHIFNNRASTHMNSYSTYIMNTAYDQYKVKHRTLIKTCVTPVQISLEICALISITKQNGCLPDNSQYSMSSDFDPVIWHVYFPIWSFVTLGILSVMVSLTVKSNT